MLFQKRCCQPRKLGNLRECNQSRPNNLLEIQDPAWSSNPDASPSLIWVEKERIARLESLVTKKKFLSPVRFFPAGFSMEWCFGPAQLSGQADGSLKMGVFKGSHSHVLASLRVWDGGALAQGFQVALVCLMALHPLFSSRFLGKWVKQLVPAGEQTSQRHLQQLPLPAGMLSIFPCPLRGEKGQRMQPHTKAGVHHGNCFSCKEPSLSSSDPKRTRDLQACLPTLPSPGWDLKEAAANQSLSGLWMWSFYILALDGS